MATGSTPSRPTWLQDPTLAWRPAERGVVLCALPHDLTTCLGPDAAPDAVHIAPPSMDYAHLCGLGELLSVLMPAVDRHAPGLRKRHAATLALLGEGTAGGTAGGTADGAGDHRRLVPVSETASLGTTRRISRESHSSALWIDGAARFLVDAVELLGGHPVLVLDAFDYWDRVSIRVLYRAVLIADREGRPFTVRGVLRDGGTHFLGSLALQRAVRMCDGSAGPALVPRDVPALRVGPWRPAESTEPLRAIGDAISLQNFEHADLLIAAHLAAVENHGGRADDRADDQADHQADLIRLQAISDAQKGRIGDAVAKLGQSLEIARDPELRAHLNYLTALLVTKRKDDTDGARTYYRRGLACIDALDEPGEAALVEKAWILNGIALAAAIDARNIESTGSAEDASARDKLFEEAFALEFSAFRMVRGMEGASAFYLRYNLSHNLAFLLQITGRHRQAEEFLRSVSKNMLSTGRPEFFVLHHYAIAVLQLRRESYEEAAATFAAALDVANARRDPFHLEKLLAAAAYTDLRREDYTGAARQYRDAARVARRLCDEEAYARNLAGLLWALALDGADWDRHTLAAARIWYPEAAGACDRRSSREELLASLTLAGAEVAPPSSKLPSYLPSVDLEGMPGRDLNRFLAGITASESPGRLSSGADTQVARMAGSNA